MANIKNYAYIKEINDIELENKIMRQKIEYATGSAFAENRIKGELGLGSENDYKIIVDNKLKDIDLYPSNKSENIPIIKRWINLFTQ